MQGEPPKVALETKREVAEDSKKRQWGKSVSKKLLTSKVADEAEALLEKSKIAQEADAVPEKSEVVEGAKAVPGLGSRRPGWGLEAV